jgi:hypothetical protein
MSKLDECKGCGVIDFDYGVNEKGYCQHCQYEHEAKQDAKTDNEQK